MYSGDFGDYYPSIREAGTKISSPLKSLSLLFDTYVPARKIFTCPSTTDNCNDLQPGLSFQAHGGQTAGDNRQTSFGYDDTRGVNTPSDIVIAADAPPAAASGDTSGGGGEGGGATTEGGKNSDNHQGEGQNILFYGGDTVVWIPNTKNPQRDTDDIYSSTSGDPSTPGISDSYIRQTASGGGEGGP
jgi:hypothetical protein